MTQPLNELTTAALATRITDWARETVRRRGRHFATPGPHIPNLPLATDAVDRFVDAWLDPETQQRVARFFLAASVVVAMLGLTLAGARHNAHHAIADAAMSHFSVGDLGERTVAPRGASPVTIRSEAPVELAAAVPAPGAVRPAAPTLRGALPAGKGMWIYLPEKVEGGNVQALVARAQQVGLTHVYVRTGSSRMGFYAQDYLNRLLPAAHAAGIRVYGWDFPYLVNIADDVSRSVAAITHTTPDGHRIDGFSADIEVRSMGVNIAPDTAAAYGAGLRKAVGPNYPLIATVPRPSPVLVSYPYDQVVASFDAIAPMVYWLNRQPDSDVAGAIANLSRFGKPVIPVGQAYDGFAEGGRPGVPPYTELVRFMQTAEAHGATSVSFWSWQHADGMAWKAIQEAWEFQLPTSPAAVFRPGQIRAYQALLSSLGFATAIDGVWGPQTVAAVQAYQQAAKLPLTGVIDDATRALMLTPFSPPIQPQP